jgi:hypothetical protein
MYGLATVKGDGIGFGEQRTNHLMTGATGQQGARRGELVVEVRKRQDLLLA